MQRIVNPLLAGLGLILITACSSGSKGDKNTAVPVAADAEPANTRAPKPVELSPEEAFVAICEKKSGEPSQHASSDAIRQWFAEDFGAFVSCQDVYSFYNTQGFLAPLFLVDKKVSDLSIIEYFDNLGTFVSSGNQIEDWSPLGSRAALQIVSIVGSNLSKVPDELVGKPLIRLILGNSPITDFSNLSQITTLELVSLNNLGLSSIPQELASSSALQVLIMDGNPLTNFTTLTQTTALTVLSLFNTGITRVPAQVSGLSKLAVLELSSNRLGANPDFTALDANASIQELYLEGVGLNAVPTEIGSMAELQILFIGENPALTSDYSGLTGSTSLVGIRMNGNGLAAIPTEIPGLEQLEALGANRNNIGSVAPIANMTSLVALGLADNPIAAQATKNTDNCPSGATAPAVASFCAGVVNLP